MKGNQRKKRAVRLSLLLAMIFLFAACRESTFDENFDPRVIKEAFASWGFTSASDYTYDSNFIEVGGNKASLKQVGTHSGSDFSNGTHTGTTLSSGVLKLSNTTNNAELDATWAPQWGNIIGYWRLESSGADASGFNSTGSLIGTAAFSGVSKIGSYGLSVTGSGGRFEVPDAVHLKQQNLKTMCAWIRKTGDSTDPYGYIIRKGDLWNDDTIHLQVENGNPANLAFQTSKPSTAANYGAVVNSIVTQNVWHHICGIVRAGNIELILNGRKIAQTNITELPNDSVSSLKIGAMGANFATFNGQIDEVALWSTDLSESEINNIYSRQRSKFSGSYFSPITDLGSSGNWTALSVSAALPFFKELPGSSGSETSANYSSVSGNLMSGLVGLWHLNETAATGGVANDFLDSSGLGNHGEQVSGVTFGAAGKFGRAASFDGVNWNRIDVGSNASLDPSVITISAWAFRLSGTGQYPQIVHNEDFANGLGYYLGDPSGGATDEPICFRVNGTTGNAFIPCEATVALNQWVHYVGIFDGDKVYLYKNGKLEASRDPAFTTIAAYTGYSKKIGSSQYKGLIDEVSIWNRALSSNEILQLYRRGANRLKYQVRSCDDSACAGESWQGPDNTASTYFSELHNYTAIDPSGNGSGSVQATPLDLAFSDFNAAGLSVSNNRYFQYRVIMESDDENDLCSGAPCMPELTSITVGPTGRYYGGSPSISNKYGVSYSTIQDVTLSIGGSCTPKFQLSKDGSTFYYWNGSAWTLATSGITHSNISGDIRSNIASFSNSIGSGQFFFKAFLPSDTSQSCELNSVGLQYVQ